MAILDIFKKKHPPKKKKEVVEKKEEKVIEKKEPKTIKKGPVIYGIVREPHISEKATDLAAVDRYVFKVFPRANKTEIKKAIQSLYGVEVLTVNIVKTPGKERRLGRTIGFKKGYKKAMVKIKKGQKIEII